MTFARTKIQAPRPRASYVERPALHAKLAQALATQRVVLLCAPAGYGKTMQLAQALADRPAVAWISADHGDDVQRLTECMVAALEPFDPPWRTAPESLVARVGRSDDDRKAVAAEILNALEACEVAHGVIAFDDLHRVDDAAFFRLLDLLVERLSPRWTIAITSRVDPPIALARLRAADELAEFRQLQLQFARDDARRMAQDAGVDQALADKLFDRTQGWPAGLRIGLGAARSDASHAGSPEAIDRALRAGNRPLFDFLLTEVLGELEPELAEFLMRVSVLAELDAKRGAAVSGSENAAALIDRIERVGLCFDVLDAPTRTLRLHDLMRDALQQRLALERPELLRHLRTRAAETEPDPIRRIGLRLDAENYAAAARDLYDHVPPIIATQGTSTARHLIERFPASFRDRSPEIAFVQGLIAWVHWDFMAMLAAFERADGLFEATGQHERALHARTFRATGLVAHGRLDDADAALATMRAADLAPETRIMLLNAEAWLAIDTGRLRAVAPRIDEMVHLLERSDRLEQWYHTTTANRMPGLPGTIKPLQRHAAALLRVVGDASLTIRAIAILTQAWCAMFQGRIDEAVALRDRAREDAAWTGHTGAIIGHMMALTSFLEALRGDAAAAIETARERERILGVGYGTWGRYTMKMLQLRVASIGEDAAALREIAAHLDALRESAGGSADEPRALPQRPALAELAWLDGRVDAAIALWRDALRHDEAIDLYGQASETRIRLARALARRGEFAEAAKLVHEVVERADADDAPGGALFAGSALAELASRDWGAALGAAERDKLRTWSRWVARPPAREPAPTSSSEPLSPRELDVLARIAAGDSNKLIARAFDLSPHTVKRHVANILGKLAVETRGQAAAWYRSRAG